MNRLTVNKETKDMTMVELARNCCYIKDREAMYRDYEKNLSARDFIRRIMVKYGYWEENEDSILAREELINDETFDDTIIDLFQFGEDDQEGLIALLYRNLWAMAELRDTLKAYEDTGLTPEQIKILNGMYHRDLRNVEKIEDYYTRHRQQCENWSHGEPQRCWMDENEVFCINYLDGSCWSYEEDGNKLKWKRKGVAE